MVTRMFVLGVTLLTGVAKAGFTNDEALTYSGSAVMGSPFNPKIVALGSGKVGLGAKRDSTTNFVLYAEWQSGSGVTLKEDAWSPLTYSFQGLAYANGQAHVGGIFYLPEGIRAAEYIRQNDGTWTLSSTGYNTTGTSYCYGTYTVNPATRQGAFTIQTNDYSMSYLYKDAGGSWQKSVLETETRSSPTCASLAFATNGTPYALWENPATQVRKGGSVTPGSAVIANVGSGYYYLHGKVAVDGNGLAQIVYFNAAWQLAYRSWTGTGWSAETVIDSSTGYPYGSLTALAFAVGPNGQKTVLYTTTSSVRLAAWNSQSYSWDCETILNKACYGLDLSYDSEGNLYGLYCDTANSDAGTSAQFHILSGFVPPPPWRVYLKVMMGGASGNTLPCVVRIWANMGKSTRAYGNIYQTGLYEGECTTNWPYYTGDFFTANSSSEWVDIGSLLSRWDVSTVGLCAIQQYQLDVTGGSIIGLPASNYTVYLSTTASDTGIFKTLNRSGAGGGYYLLIDPMHLDATHTVCDADASTTALVAAQALSATGSRPVLFPVTTGEWLGETINSSYAVCDPVNVVAKESNVLSALGFNGNGCNSYDAALYGNGLTKLEYFFYPWSSVSSGDKSQLTTDLVSPRLVQAANSINATGHAANVIRYQFDDESNSMTMTHIVSCTNCKNIFQQKYLPSVPGLMPAFFGVSSWSQVTPTTDKINYPRQFYYTALFRNWIMTQAFQIGTNILTGQIAGLPTSVNFGEESTYYGNVQASGLDWFDLFRQGALTYGWTEEWLNHSTSYQLCGYRADLLRGACNAGAPARSFGMYNILCGRSFWDIQVNAITEIGHGAQAIYHYNYGPYYTGSADATSQDISWYPFIKQTNFAIGAVEKYLVGASVPKAKIALLHSRSTDIWTMDQPYSASGKDRMGIYLILRHLGYPVDILDEYDVATGKLGAPTATGYKVLICTGSNLLTSAIGPLVNWLQSGGLLYLDAGALSGDEFNNPLMYNGQSLDSFLGLVRQTYQYVQSPGREYYEFPTLTNQAPLHCGGEVLEALCGYQYVSNAIGWTVFATFDASGTSAAMKKTIGSGTVVFCGFFPGLGYQKGGIITKKARIGDAQYPSSPIVTYGSTDWPASYRNFFNTLLSNAGASLTVPVSTSHYLLEANRLDNGTDSIITLSNWSGTALNNVTISLPRNGRLGLPNSVLNPIQSRQTVNGQITLTMNLAGPFDFILLPASSDLAAVVAAMDSRVGDGNYNLALDYDNDGEVTSTDLAILLMN